jgi:hypothetical protein
MVSVSQVELPDFGDEARLPVVSTAGYERRLDMTVERMEEHGLQFLLVYADREHSANMSYLIGFDPRFEESVLLLDTKGNRLLLVGNECLGYVPDPALKCQVELFQEFSLLGQQRDDSAPLRRIVSDFGMGKGAAVGCVGWKYFTGRNVDHPAHAMEIPSYIVDLVRDVVQDRRRIVSDFGTGKGAAVGCVGWKYFTGHNVDHPAHAMEIPSYIVDLVRDVVQDRRRVTNATHLFMNPDTGLRIINSVDQIARFEYAAIKTSNAAIKTSKSILSAVNHITEGVAEKELERHFFGGGLPRSCHPMISFGEKVRRGLSSPSDNVAHMGDAFVIAFGVEGALNCRAGVVGRGPEDLPDEIGDFYPQLAANYFQVVVSWYESVKVGAVAGDVYAAVDAQRRRELFSFAVNPGHYIHLDEWVHSPFVEDSLTTLQSGTALQMDIIPVSQGPFCYINAEDGVVLADEALREGIASRYPDSGRPWYCH